MSIAATTDLQEPTFVSSLPRVDLQGPFRASSSSPNHPIIRTTNLYLTRPLKAHALSAPVGSGKSYAAARYLAREDMAHRNVLYVAPTIRLIEQVEEGLRGAIADARSSTIRNVHLIHSENRQGSGLGTHQDALDAINQATEGDGLVLVLTTTTFLAVLSRIQRPEQWSVILDEAFQPMAIDSFILGQDPLKSWTFFRSMFDVDPNQGNRIVPAKGKREAVKDIASGVYVRTGEEYRSMDNIARCVANSALRTELVMTDPIRTLLAGGTPERKQSKGKEPDAIAETRMEFASYVSPEHFLHFQEVIFLCALFEETVLYHLWTKALGVTFQEHPRFPKEELRDIHTEQGRFLAVGHLLHPRDTPSKLNLQRNRETGEQMEKRAGHRVLDLLVDTAASYFGEQRFLLQTNSNMGYGPKLPLTPSTAVSIPAYAHGMNSYQDVDNVAALCVTNPTPQEMSWVRDRTGMDGAAVGRAYRIHSTYQALGRCSIRRRVPTMDRKVLLCVGKAEADFILNLFPGSHDLGQIGSAPDLRSLERSTLKKAPKKGAVVAELIQEYLFNLPPDVSSITSRSLRAAIESGQNSIRIINGEVSGFDRLWTRAVSSACHAGSGWKKEGHRVVRVTADAYGFAVQ